MDAAVKVIALAVALGLESSHRFCLEDVKVTGIQVSGNTELSPVDGLSLSQRS